MFILKSKSKIKESAEKLIDQVRIENSDNSFFTEISFIEKSEIKLKYFIEKRNLVCFVLYSLLNSIGIVNTKEVDLLYIYYFNRKMFVVLSKNATILEMNRLFELFIKRKQDNISIRQIFYIINDNDIIKYLYSKEFYSKDFFDFIIRKIENDGFKGQKKYNSESIKTLLVKLKEIIG